MTKEWSYVSFLFGVILSIFLPTAFSYNILINQETIFCVDYQKNIIHIDKDDLNISLNRNRVYIDGKKITLDRCY